MRQSMGDVGVDGTLPLHDLVDSSCWHPEVIGEMPHTEASRREKFFEDDSARMNRQCSFSIHSLRSLFLTT